MAYIIPVEFEVKQAVDEAPLAASQALERVRTAVGEAIANFIGGNDEELKLAEILDSGVYGEPYELTD